MPNDMESQILGILDAPGEPSETHAPAQTPAPAPEAAPAKPPEGVVGEPQEQTTTGEEPVVAAEDKPPEAAPGPELPKDLEVDEEIGPPALTEGGKVWSYPESRARTLHAGYKEAKLYRQFAPTPADAETHMRIYLDHSYMLDDLTSGDPNRIGRIVNYFNKQAPASVPVLIEQTLAHKNSPAYDAAAATVLRDLTEHFYSQYAQSPDKESDEAEGYRHAAQFLEQFLTGSFRPPESVKPVTTLDRREAEVAMREQRLRDEADSRMRQEQSTWVGETNSKIREAVRAEIEQSLAPLSEVRKHDPYAYRGVYQEIFEGAQNAINSDKPFLSLFGHRYAEVRDGQRGDEDRKALIEMYVQRTRRAIASLAPKAISAASSAFVRKNQQVHERAAESNTHREPAPGGPSSAPTVTNQRYADARKNRDLEGMTKALLGV